MITEVSEQDGEAVESDNAEDYMESTDSNMSSCSESGTDVLPMG